MAPITAAGWKGVHKDVVAPEGGGGGPQRNVCTGRVLLRCLNPDHVVQEKLCSAGCPGPLGAKATSGQGPASPLVGF